MKTWVMGFAVAALAACGGGGDDDVGDDAPGDPVLVVGGGVTGGAIAGRLNVFVIDEAVGAGISGATVQVGDGPTATTDADGLAVFADAALSGPQTVTATASGHVAGTWVGVAGSSVTIPLETTVVPTASASGTIAGWDGLPAPAFGNYNLAVILYTLTADIGARENTLTQGTSGGAPVNTCLRSAVSNSCAWQLTTRVGVQSHYAVIVEGNPQGTTSDPSDDTYQLIGYAIGASMGLAPGQQVTGETLQLVATGSHAGMTVGFPGAPAGLGDVIALPMLDLDDGSGRIVFPLPTVTPGAASTQVIAPSGRFAGSYDVVGVASPPGAAAAPYSTTIERGAAPGSVQLAPWLPAPAQLAVSGDTVTFADVGPDAVRYATFERGGTRLWTVSILDRSTSFTLPAVTPDPLGTGTIELEITAADVGAYDASDFHVDDFTAGLARAAGATTTFTR
jgi:hypothetical protein